MTTGVFGGTTPKRVALPALAGAAGVLRVAALAFSFDLTRLAADIVATRVRASGAWRDLRRRLEFA